MKKLENKWALVTGSSRGIGQRIALGLADLGCNVIVHGRSQNHTADTIAQLKHKGVEIQSVAGDLASEAGVANMIDQVQALDVNIDILYNNAAINNTPTPIFEFTIAEWVHTFQVNVYSVVQLCNAFGPGMRERKWGRIINMTSGIADQPNLAPYSASKAAIDKFSRDLATEFKEDNVLISYVDPGWIRTDLGGPDAWEDVHSVVPGVLVPALLPNGGANGRFYAAQDFKGLWD